VRFPELPGFEPIENGAQFPLASLAIRKAGGFSQISSVGSKFQDPQADFD
jgi:hypothetical protein